MDDLYWGIIGFVAVLSLMALGVHVGLALAATGFIGMFLMTGKISLALALFTTTPYSTTNVYAFAILPLFIIMGLFAMHAGLSARAFDAAYKWVGRLPGGMAIATTWANAMFAACTGSSVVACAVFTRISLPEMDRRGYDKAFACGTIAAAGMLGMLIPPSALMIVYGILTEQSIGKLLIAGVGPGILLTLIFTIGIVVVAARYPDRAPRADYAPPLLERLKATIGVVGIVVLVVGIIAGMYTGIFTPPRPGLPVPLAPSSWPFWRPSWSAGFSAPRRRVPLRKTPLQTRRPQFRTHRVPLPLRPRPSSRLLASTGSDSVRP